MKTRDSASNFLKGVAIVLMIVGHAGAFGWRGLSEWIYLFHMPVFFMLAVLFYRGIADLSAKFGYGICLDRGMGWVQFCGVVSLCFVEVVLAFSRVDLLYHQF